MQLDIYNGLYIQGKKIQVLPPIYERTKTRACLVEKTTKSKQNSETLTTLF